MKTTALHPRFGIEVHDLDLRAVSAERGYPELRALFEEHSLLLFRDQDLDDASHMAFGELWGPIEVRSKDPVKPAPEMSVMTNRRADGVVAGANEPDTLWLRANQFWHTDSTFLPVPALANILAARIVTSSGGETEFVSTRAAWQDMPEAMKERARDAVLRHRYAHSRARLDAELARDPRITMWEDTAWRAVWANPVNGRKALYLASHAFGVVGLPDSQGQALIDELTAFSTQDHYVYSHAWEVGDVIVWDERATMHRGRPWPYEEERKLASICISLQECDGLEAMRPPAEAA